MSTGISFGGAKNVFKIEVVFAKHSKHNPSKCSALGRLIVCDLDFVPLNDFFFNLTIYMVPTE